MESKRVFLIAQVCVSNSVILKSSRIEISMLASSPALRTQEEFDEDEEFRLELRKQARTLLDGF